MLNVVVYELDSTGFVCATLTGFQGPEGLATDTNGNLYVVDTVSSTIIEFAPPYTGPPIYVYQDFGYLPVSVAVDGSGNLAVANGTTENQGAGDIAFYRKGDTAGPTRTVSSPTFETPQFCAFDKSDDLVLDGFSSRHGVDLGAIPHNGNTIVQLTVSNRIVDPGGMQFNDAGQLVILDQGPFLGPGSLYTYNVTGRNLGNPVLTTTLANSTDPVSFAFSAGDTLFLSADAGNDYSEPYVPGAAELYRYPAGGIPLRFSGLHQYGAVPFGAAIVSTRSSAQR